MKSSWAIIPARSGSKGIKNKNIASIGGYPLLAWTIACAKMCPSISRVIVSTDSPEYAAIAETYGAEAPFLRPAKFADDMSTDYDWVRHLIEWYQREEVLVPDYLVHLRPTTPFRDPVVVESAISKFVNRTYSTYGTSLRSAHLLEEHPYKMFIKEGDFYRSFYDHVHGYPKGAGDPANQPRQSFRDVYVPNGYVDILDTWHVLDVENLHGSNILAYETDKILEIDTPCNLECAMSEFCRKEINSPVYQYLERLF